MVIFQNPFKTYLPNNLKSVTGWQMRWFVLENGVLAYYKSEEDVNSGCKGSVKVSTCEIDRKSC